MKIMNQTATSPSNPIESPDALMEKALIALKQAHDISSSFLAQIAGPKSGPYDADAELSIDCFLDRHTAVMNEVIKLSTSIFNDVIRVKNAFGG